MECPEAYCSLTGEDRFREYVFMQMQAYSPITLHWNKSSQHCFLLGMQIVHRVMVVLFQRAVDNRVFHF